MIEEDEDKNKQTNKQTNQKQTKKNNERRNVAGRHFQDTLLFNSSLLFWFGNCGHSQRSWPGKYLGKMFLKHMKGIINIARKMFM